MANETNQEKFIAIKSMFTAGNVRRMRDIEAIYPTLVAKALRLNHSRYIEKLYKPEGFSIKNILEMAALFDVDPTLILQVVIKQLSTSKAIRRKF